VADIIDSDQIAGVKFVTLKAFLDDRGRFLESFRKEWFPERSWQNVQMNSSKSRAGVLRGLHYHFKQVDYWYVPQGKILVGLADIRTTSATRGHSQMVEIGEENEMGVFIPSGVAHGFLALTDATMVYVVDQYHNKDDELGVAWDDPAFSLKWGVASPIISARDQNNPRWQEIDPAQMP